MIVVGILLAVTVFAVIVVGGWVVDRLEPDDCARPKRHHDSSTTPDRREAREVEEVGELLDSKRVA